MRQWFRAFAFALTALLLAACSNDELDETSPRSASAPAAGVTIVTILAGVGHLEIVGEAGAEAIEAEGTARARTLRELVDLELIVVANGTDVTIEALTPPNTELDVVVILPASVAVVVEKEVGGVEARDVNSMRLALDVGSAVFARITGNVDVENLGVGNIQVSDVAGTVHIQRFGVGNVEIDNVEGDVAIDQGGTGNIDIRDVGGNLTIRDYVVGRLQYTGIEGTVDVR